MASARGGGGGGSSSGSSRGSVYDVFVSFRGPDTRVGFVDCLYEDMTQAGIRVFVDNERLHVGEVIGEELIHAIDDSKICIPVFSKNYASSKWCLRELECIMKSRPGQEVMPVFYDASPDDVKLKTRLYSDHLEELEKEHGSDVVDGWRKCLKEVCTIKGWYLEEFKGLGKLIKKIVQEVLNKTKKRHKNVSDLLVGIEGQVDAMIELLDDRIDDVRFVVIHGMGGIGKTTLAQLIFNQVYEKFQGCSFISNVRESSLGNGIVKLQQQILKDILRMSASIDDVHDGINEIKERCCCKKVLLVLDDVNDREQVQKLAGMFDWFGRGSRIIITTRDSSVIPIGLLSHDEHDKKKKWRRREREDNHGDIRYYEMREMDHQHATTLFKRHAFGVDENSSDYDDLLCKIIATTGGLPLTLEVVGSHLFGQTEAVWKETLKKLEQGPHKDVEKALMISYEPLEDDQKQIFLDIACFFRGIEKCFPMYMWEASDLCPESGMSALLHKSLIKIVDRDQIWMHDQLRDLGRKIVRKDGKSSRIWIPEEAFHMISDKKGTGDVVLLDLGELSESCKFKKVGFEKLANLRVLRLDGGNLVGDFSNCFPQLKFLHWTSFPSNFRAKNFSPPNLTVLRLANTAIDERWAGWTGLLGSKLKVLDLLGCGGLTRTPDFSACSELEILLLQHCSRLAEIDSSIGKLKQLIQLEIRGSPNIKGLPHSLASLKKIERLVVIGIDSGEYPVKFQLPIEFGKLKSLHHLAIEYVGLESLPKGIGRLKLLKHLSFQGCSQLKNLPESVWDLESLMKLNLKRTGLTDFSGSIESMKELKVRTVSFTKIRMLSEGIGSLVKLEELDVSYCRCLEQIPSEIGNLFSLRVLNLSGTGIVELPSTVSQLSRLQCLEMASCSELRKVEQLPGSLFELVLPYFSLRVVPDLSNLLNLATLGLFSNEYSVCFINFPITDSEEVDVDQQTRIRSLNFAWIERLPQLKHLVIGVQCDIFKSLQVDLRSLSSAALHLSCSDAQSLSKLPPNLSGLILTEFRDTTLDLSLYPNLKNLSALSIFNSLTYEIELRGLQALGNLQKLQVRHCKSLERLSISSRPKNLNKLIVYECKKLVEIQGVDRMESLHELLLAGCPSLPRLPDLSKLLNILVLKMKSCQSMESMPSLPSTKRPFILHVIDCGKLRDFGGTHDLYGERVGRKRNEVIGRCFPSCSRRTVM